MQPPPNSRPDAFWVIEPDPATVPVDQRVRAADGTILTRRPNGFPGRVEVIDDSGAGLPAATLVRTAAAVGEALVATGDPGGRVRVCLGPAGAEGWQVDADGGCLRLDGVRASREASRHPLNQRVLQLLRRRPESGTAPPVGDPPAHPVPRVLLFESLMNSAQQHNSEELSQGILHMLSPLVELDTEVLLSRVKMSPSRDGCPVLGLEELERMLRGAPVGLIGVTVLEGYFEGVCSLIRTIRDLGCRAHIAVGGVMPTLAPEQVAAHLPEVSFVCRGAGEYFLPRLVGLLGPGSVDVPFTERQRRVLLDMDGIATLERAGPGLRLLAGNLAEVARVDDLDAVDLDLRYLDRRRLQNGVELSTSRGCLHRCSFCSIIGRRQYQTRSVASVVDLLGSYRRRFTELFGDDTPPSAFRLHLSDDDVACDAQRCVDLFRAILETPFRLASAQISVSDLCRTDGGRLLPEPNRELFDAIRPECFADFARPVPVAERLDDHAPRSWSSYLQIGVETFSRRELARLAKGYRIEHIRAVVAEAAARRLHVDAYLILSTAETTPDDLVDSLEEACRLKLRFGEYFHVHYPVTAHLVSYFTSASHRRLVRRGLRGSMHLRQNLHVENHAELDYPLVERDEPLDPWTRDAARVDPFTHNKRYSDTLENLAQLWRVRLSEIEDAEERRAREWTLRRLDDAPRRLTFELLAATRGDPEASRRAAATAEEVIGPAETWLPAFKRYSAAADPRLVLIPTWECELACRYCWIPNQRGRVMPMATARRAVDLLMSSSASRVQLQFFGGEPLMERERIGRVIDYARERARAADKELSFILSSNGWSLDHACLEWLAGHPVKLELSLDGDPETQNRYRPAREPGADSYANGIAPRAGAILSSGLAYDVIMVVHVEDVERMPHNFFHIADLGFERIQINFMQGVRWSNDKQRVFAEGLLEIGEALRRRWRDGQRLELINAQGTGEPMPMRLNGEVTVDWDGRIYGGNGFLHEGPNREMFALGHLDDLGHFDRYVCDGPPNTQLLAWTHPPGIIRNNLAVGSIMTSFVRWLREAPEWRSRSEQP